jgi:hypothetical protein
MATGKNIDESIFVQSVSETGCFATPFISAG